MGFKDLPVEVQMILKYAFSIAEDMSKEDANTGRRHCADLCKQIKALWPAEFGGKEVIK